MSANAFTLALVAYPHACDLDEFDALARVPGVDVVRVTQRERLADAECIVLPGSRDAAADLAWLRRGGLDNAIALHGAARRPVLGVGGGMQMLGEALIDPAAIAGNAPGLGLLAIVSLLESRTAPTPLQLSFGPVIGQWAPLAAMQLPALELHQGRSVQHQGMGAARVVLSGGLGWQNAEGNVLGLFARGVFEHAAVRQALFGAS
jgi:adenosylcobyric acid synthase